MFIQRIATCIRRFRACRLLVGKCALPVLAGLLAQGAAMGFDFDNEPTLVLDFSPAEARVTTDVTFSGLSDVTLSVWIKRLIKPTNFEAVAGQGYLQTNNGFGLFLNSSGNINFQTRTGSTTVTAAAPYVFDGKWHHVAGVRDGDDTILYLDGVEVARDTGALTSLTPSNSRRFGLGARDSGTWGFNYNGLIAEVRLWDHARSQAQIQASMNQSLAGNESGLIGYWPVDDGSGTTVTDQSAGDNDGTVVSAKWVSSTGYRYVWPESPTPGNGFDTWNTAAHTIQDAIDAASHADTIWLSAGTHTAPHNPTNYVGTNVVFLNKPLTLRGTTDNPADTIIDGEGTNRVIAVVYKSATPFPFVIDSVTVSNGFAPNMGGGILFNADNVVSWKAIVHNSHIVGNTVFWATNSNDLADPLRGTWGSRGGGIGQYAWTTGLDIVLSNSEIRNNTALDGPQPSLASDRSRGGGLFLSGFSLFTGTDLLIEHNSASGGGGGFIKWPRTWMDRCIIRHNLAWRNSGEDAGGGLFLGQVSTGGGGRSWLRNCLIYDNEAWQGGGVSVQRGPVVEMDGCTVVDNRGRLAGGGGGVHLRFISQGAGLLVWNSIAYHNSNNDLNLSGDYSSSYFTNNCFAVTNFLQGAGNITNAPVFVNFDGADFRPKPDSPTVNAGVFRDWMTDATDLAGNPRLDRIHQTVDIGAYEYHYQGSILLVR